MQNETSNHKLTDEVCALLDMTRAALNSWLSRHERFKPKQRAPGGAMLWTDAEIAAVKAARAARPPATAWRNEARRAVTGGQS